MAAALASAVGPGGEEKIQQVRVDATLSEDDIQRAVLEDPDMQMIAAKLDSDVTISADRELRLDNARLAPDSDSVSTSSSAHDNIDDDDDDDADDNDNVNNADGHHGDGHRSISDRVHETLAAQPPVSEQSPKNSNGTAKTSPVLKGSTVVDSSRSSSRKSSLQSTGASNSDSQNSKKESSSKNPLRLLRRLTKFDKSKSSKKTDYTSEFAAVVVDRLPQVFVVKYLGHRRVTGVCGLHHVRKPVDEMVRAVKEKLTDKSEIELPLLYVVISPKGLDLREHKTNKVRDTAPLGLMPIDFISYGVQDIKFWRVFTCIVVRELSSRSRAATCHAFLCDSSHNGRKMALALGAAFNLYSRKLKTAGKMHNFQVELRPPDELADAVDAECEA